MSVSAIGGNTSASLRQADTQSSNTASTSGSATSTTNTAGAGSTSAAAGSAPESSSQVTLSPAAQALATLAAEGYTVAVTDANGNAVGASALAGVNLPAQQAGEKTSAYALQVFGALTSALASSGYNIGMTNPSGLSMSEVRDPGLQIPSNAAGWAALQQSMATAQSNAHIAPPTSGGQYDGEISKSAFAKVVAQLGGTEDDANQIFAGLDTNKNGYLTNAQLLTAISGLGAGTGAAGSSQQALLQLLSAGGGAVSGGQLLSFETALQAAETPAS
jgi:hypothetical protein